MKDQETDEFAPYFSGEKVGCNSKQVLSVSFCSCAVITRGLDVTLDAADAQAHDHHRTQGKLANVLLYSRPARHVSKRVLLQARCVGTPTTLIEQEMCGGWGWGWGWG